MPLVPMKGILNDAKKDNYAVGAFDAMDQIMVEAILGAAEETNTPIILMVMMPTFCSDNTDLLLQYMVDRCRKSPIPVALHLDHGTSFEVVMQAIHYGFTSVMFDGSSLPFEENVTLTQKVVEAAHACGVTVEAEIGHVSGHEGNMLNGNVADQDTYTTVDAAIQFYQRTKVDCLAVAIGTVHGVYAGVPKLDYVRLQAIRDAIPIPIVMHGGSGLMPEDFRQAIEHGISKINFFTGMSLGGAEAVKDFVLSMDATSTKFAMADVIRVGQTRMSQIIKEHILIFGTPPVN